jgi:hypothetical protein
MNDGSDIDSAPAGLRPILMKVALRPLRNPAWAADVVSGAQVAAFEPRRAAGHRGRPNRDRAIGASVAARGLPLPQALVGFRHRSTDGRVPRRSVSASGSDSAATFGQAARDPIERHDLRGPAERSAGRRKAAERQRIERPLGQRRLAQFAACEHEQGRR